MTPESQQEETRRVANLGELLELVGAEPNKTVVETKSHDRRIYLGKLEDGKHSFVGNGVGAAVSFYTANDTSQAVYEGIAPLVAEMDWAGDINPGMRRHDELNGLLQKTGIRKIT